MSKGVSMTTSNNVDVASNFVDINAIGSPAWANLQRAVFDFDINIVTAPATGFPQGATNVPNGQLFAMNVFNNNGSGRVFRFGVSPTSATGGVFGMRNNTDGDLILIPGFTYNNGETHHVQILMDFITQTTDTYLDGALTPSLANIPFVNASPGLGEFFVFQNGSSAGTSEVALDNFVLFVPEPSTISLLGIGIVGLIRRRRV
jgi:hypothetical protein